jgi:hypothetical protein
MSTTTHAWRNVTLTVLMILPVTAGCLRPIQRHELCRPWPGYAPVPCRREAPCQSAPVLPVDICAPVCLRPAAAEGDTRTGLRTNDATELLKSAARRD